MFEDEYSVRPSSASAPPPVATTPAVRPTSMVPGKDFYDSTVSDVAESFKSGQYARGVGQATRGAVALPGVAAYEAGKTAVNALAPVGNAAKEFYQGFTGAAPSAATPAAPAAPAAVVPKPVVRPSAAAPVVAAAPAPQPVAAPAETVQPNQPTAVQPNQGGGITIIRPSAVRDLPSLNNAQISGPLGGLYNAVLALTAGRAINSQRQADFNNDLKAIDAVQKNKESQARNAQAEQSSRESATRERGQQLANEKTEGDLKRQKRLEDLDEQIAKDDGKDPAKTRRLQQQRAALVGKQPRNLQVTTYEEPLDPANPILGTKKTPVIIDQDGNAQFVRPSAAAVGNAPQGMKQVGTSNGVPVYEDSKGNRFTQ